MKNIFKIILTLSVFSFSCVMHAQIEEVDMIMTDCPVGVFINGKQISPLRYSKSNVGKGAFLSGLTYGIAKTSNTLEYKGKISHNILNIGDTVSFVFGKVPTKYVATMYGFSPSYSPNSFGIGEFKVKKDKRELKTATVSLWTGVNSGTEQSKKVSLSSLGNKILSNLKNNNEDNINEQLEKIRATMPSEYQQYIPNINLSNGQNDTEYIEYQFIVTEAEPGEYCFMFTEKGASGYHPVFDFSVQNNNK